MQKQRLVYTNSCFQTGPHEGSPDSGSSASCVTGPGGGCLAFHSSSPKSLFRIKDEDCRASRRWTRNLPLQVMASSALQGLPSTVGALGDTRTGWWGELCGFKLVFLCL